MPLEHHPLNREFPEFKDTMRTLLQSAGEASGKRVTLDIRD